MENLPDLSNGIPKCEVCGENPMFTCVDGAWICRECMLKYHEKMKSMQKEDKEKNIDKLKKMLL